MTGLHVNNINVKIKEKQLVRDVSFAVDSGQIMALVGHNGAGKSTVIRTVLGLQEKQNGKVIINNTFSLDDDYIAYKQQLSYIPEEPLLLPELTVMQHFQLYGMSYQMAEDELHQLVDYYMKQFDMEGKLNEYPESLSKGMRQKVQTICALLPDVSVLLIDEPFMGLDVYAIEFLEAKMREKAQRGTAILLTTHQMDRVKTIADEFVMLQEGTIIDQGPMQLIYLP